MKVFIRNADDYNFDEIDADDDSADEENENYDFWYVIYWSYITGGGGGGGAYTKVPDMYGVGGGGGVFGTQNTKVTCTLLYNKGGVSIFYPESQKYKWYFCTPIS